jgi:hypothetical protein
MHFFEKTRSRQRETSNISRGFIDQPAVAGGTQQEEFMLGIEPGCRR